MIIIQRRKIKPQNYYQIHCDCGCVFAFCENEFRNINKLGVMPNIYCPECNREYIKSSKYINSISENLYSEYLDKGFCEVQK